MLPGREMTRELPSESLYMPPSYFVSVRSIYISFTPAASRHGMLVVQSLIHYCHEYDMLINFYNH